MLRQSWLPLLKEIQVELAGQLCALQSREQYPPGYPLQKAAGFAPGAAEAQSGAPVQALPIWPAAGPPATQLPLPVSQRRPAPHCALSVQAGVQEVTPLPPQT